MAQEVESGEALGNCRFICERFTKVEDIQTGTSLPDGNHTVDAVTIPLNFIYHSQSVPWALGTTSNFGGNTVFWGRFLAPGSNFSNSTWLEFPSGISVGLAMVRVRSQGGDAWDVIPVDPSGNPVSFSGQNRVPAGDNPVETMFVCADEFFSGLLFFNPFGGTEPAVYEVCVPVDPETCMPGGQ